MWIHIITVGKKVGLVSHTDVTSLVHLNLELELFLLYLAILFQLFPLLPSTTHALSLKGKVYVIVECHVHWDHI